MCGDHVHIALCRMVLLNKVINWWSFPPFWDCWWLNPVKKELVCVRHKPEQIQLPRPCQSTGPLGGVPRSSFPAISRRGRTQELPDEILLRELGSLFTLHLNSTQQNSPLPSSWFLSFRIIPKNTGFVLLEISAFLLIKHFPRAYECSRLGKGRKAGKVVPVWRAYN